MRKINIYIIFQFLLSAQLYNHPELAWEMFETEHFKIHFYESTEQSAREGAAVAERIFPFVTELYDYVPVRKTSLIFTDTDDYANGAAYFYDNKIVIWTSPLDYELRGSHRWLQNVITHEFTHIVSIQKAMKFGSVIPGAYLQVVGYEKEKRKDVLYGYPNVLVSYALPGTTVPPWLAEGSAQFMYDGADWDLWDTNRDMILRDRILNNKMLSWAEINTFGKNGIGNESVYNTGYAFCRYLAVKEGPQVLKKIMSSLSSPLNYSVNRAIKEATGKSGKETYLNFVDVLEKRYDLLTESVQTSGMKGRIVQAEGTANLYPSWSPDGNKIAFLSNREHELFGQTDLYIYDLESKISRKIVKSVHSKSTWNSNGDVLYFSRRAKLPDKHGSKYYDLYEYNFVTEKETRLTINSRAFSPVFIPQDSSLIYLATADGGQNIFKVDLQTKSTRKLTDFNPGRMLSSLTYDHQKNWIIFDVTDNHFRDIQYLSLADSTYGYVLNNAQWDERQVTVGENGGLIYADDRTGIFNLYFLGEKQGYVTNVQGGAFMPDISRDGKIAYVDFEEGRFNLAILDTMKLIDNEQVGYSATYFQRNNNLKAALIDKDLRKSKIHEDLFPPLFILPRIMYEYGEFKPGFYFYSSEILNRLTLSGGASINRFKDLDLYFLFEFRRFFPTLYLETLFMTRNTEEENIYSVYKLDNKLRFQLLQFKTGLKFPLIGTELEIFSSWNRFRAAIKEKIRNTAYEGGFAYDYFKGLDLGLKWSIINKYAGAGQNINPPSGFGINLNLAWEKNELIDNLDLSDAGTLVSNYNNNDLYRFTGSGFFHQEISKKWHLTLSAKTNYSWISNSEVDSFFYFYAGGLPGLKGYSYYSLGGTRKFIGELDLAFPILREKHIPLGWFTLQNMVMVLIVQGGDAWSPKINTPVLKKSAGLQMRLQGFSFYNYPTAIGIGIHRGFDDLRGSTGETVNIKDEKDRLYFTLLFDF